MNRREIVLGATALAACAPEARSQAPTPFPMRRGVNLGNALEAPNEGDWGYRIEPDHLSAIADAGFDGVRLPVRWSAHASSTPPYEFEPAFLGRVDQVIEGALNAGLKVQLDVHHYTELFDLHHDDLLIVGAARHRNRLIGMWRQVAQHYRDAPPSLLFEPMNEPNGRYWDTEALPRLQRRIIEVIRETNPTRTIVLGPGNWQNIDALRRWRPPEGENIAVSVHYYEPHAFTHQHASWLGDDAPTFDRDWGADVDRAAARGHIGAAARWGRERGYAMQLGEFGVNSAAPVQQRAAWTRTVREACETEGMGWCAWDFAGAFPVWNRDTRDFIPLMRDALFA